MSKIRVAIIEIGGSHDECILSEVMALKENGCYVVFCGTSDVYNRNLKFQHYFDDFKEVVFPKTMLGDFEVMRNLSKWLSNNKIEKVIANTAQGGHIRNLALTSSKSIEFYGIVHTIKMFQGSFTQNLISRKIKHYFVLNDSLLEMVTPKKGIKVDSFYPLDYPDFDSTVEKKEGEVWITIIGGVENRRKDLAGFIAIAKNAPSHVRFIFLGKTDLKREETKTFLNQLKSESLVSKVVTFSEFIDQDVFDTYLKKTDGIIPLVHPNTPSADEYFSRQISGAINVAFSYKIPLFIHSNYRSWNDFNTGVIFYELENSTLKLQEFISRLELLRVEMEVEPKFNKEYQRNRFAKLILVNQ